MFKIAKQINEYLAYNKNIHQISPNTIKNKHAILNQFASDTKLNL